jgi:hypothetical protein
MGAATGLIHIPQARDILAGAGQGVIPVTEAQAGLIAQGILVQVARGVVVAVVVFRVIRLLAAVLVYLVTGGMAQEALLYPPEEVAAVVEGKLAGLQQGVFMGAVRVLLLAAVVQVLAVAAQFV